MKKIMFGLMAVITLVSCQKENLSTIRSEWEVESMYVDGKRYDDGNDYRWLLHTDSCSGLVDQKSVLVKYHTEINAREIIFKDTWDRYMFTGEIVSLEPFKLVFTTNSDQCPFKGSVKYYCRRY